MHCAYVGCAATQCDLPTEWSRYGCGPASFRHRSGIRFPKLRDLASHFRVAGAKLCEPDILRVVRGIASPESGYGPASSPAPVQIVTFKCQFNQAGEFKRELKIKTDLQDVPVSVTVEGTATP